ncbi:uncharacterized protein FA14DRAFT_188217 [Meira miltonrushii]|uniref:Uncharacterized protein n=1 Tax=Meira miltonrushii TaxID=1280837 RepID=A0A316VL59_9BASI|nr:uncharacterized protein FA14DRAFT_188217 [Meira miltonrushii]PWN38200.1 hypothetical protein FA14DRAFT_188217 [Meira miltonrushii]
MLKQLLDVNLVWFTSLILNVLAGYHMNHPLPSSNKEHERPFHADEVTPNLPGLTNHGKAVEKELESHLQQGLRPSKVGEARVRNLWEHGKTAEYERNKRHVKSLQLKKQIQKESRTFFGRIRLRREGIQKLAEDNKIEKDQFRQTLRDIAHDTKIHRKLHTIGTKDFNHINKPKYKISKTLGYDSDGNSKGSSFGYRDKPPSPSESNEIFSRPTRNTPPPASSSSSSSIPSLPASSRDPFSSSSDNTSSHMSHASSTATSRLQSQRKRSIQAWFSDSNS